MKAGDLELINEFTHDLKTPLVKIKALVLIINNTKDPKVVAQKLEKIDKLTDLANSNVEDLVTFLNLTENNYHPIQEKFDLANVLNKATRKYQLKFKNILSQEVKGDENLTQKLLDLLINKILKYQDNDLKITVEKRIILFSFKTNRTVFHKDLSGLIWVLIMQIISSIGWKIGIKKGLTSQKIELIP